jgi:hypothetical protein
LLVADGTRNATLDTALTLRAHLRNQCGDGRDRRRSSRRSALRLVRAAPGQSSSA